MEVKTRFPVGTYGGLWNVALEELDELRQKSPDAISLFAALGARAFSYATRIVLARRSDDVELFIGNQTRLETTMEALDAWLRKHKWPEEWPSSPETFGNFQHAGQCALEVALRFATAVKAAVAYGRLESLKKGTQTLMPEMRTNLAPWMTATRNELESATLDLSSWSIAAMRRDMEVLLLKINNEIGAAKSAGPISPKTAAELKALRLKCRKRMLELEHHTTKERLAILKSEFPDLNLDKKEMDKLRRTETNAKNRAKHSEKKKS